MDGRAISRALTVRERNALVLAARARDDVARTHAAKALGVSVGEFDEVVRSARGKLERAAAARAVTVEAPIGGARPLREVLGDEMEGGVGEYDRAVAGGSEGRRPPDRDGRTSRAGAPPTADRFDGAAAMPAVDVDVFRAMIGERGPAGPAARARKDRRLELVVEWLRKVGSGSAGRLARDAQYAVQQARRDLMELEARGRVVRTGRNVRDWGVTVGRASVEFRVADASAADVGAAAEGAGGESVVASAARNGGPAAPASGPGLAPPSQTPPAEPSDGGSQGLPSPPEPPPPTWDVSAARAAYFERLLRIVDEGWPPPPDRVLESLDRLLAP